MKHIAWILKLRINYIDEIRNVKHIKVSLERLQQTDTEKTRIKVYRLCQLKLFGKELSSLEQRLPLKKSNLIPLAPLLEDVFMKLLGSNAFILYC